MATSTFLPLIEAPQLSESGLQAKCHLFFNQTYPALRGLGYMNHNDGAKNQIQAAQDVARGLVKGIPDWFLAVARHGFHGLYIEFKVGHNTLDKWQVKRIEQLRAQGYQVEVVRTEAEYQHHLTNYLA
ncbi:VRR-NUC domain-containing protein [Hymenobacter sp. HD11105]